MSDSFIPQTPIQETAQKLAANELSLKERRDAQGVSPQGFKAALQQAAQANGLKFSAHAQDRMQSRNIQLSPQSLSKLSAVVDKASAKGAQESLILMNDTAFVVSVKNRTVITAVDGPSLKDNIFTNIDSAAIL